MVSFWLDSLWQHKNRLLRGFFLGAVAASLVLAPIPVDAAPLTTGSLGLSDSRPSQVAQYTLSAGGFTTGTTIGCIEVDMGTASDGTGSISGLSTGSSTFVSQSITASGTWAVSNTASADHKLRLTNGTPVAPQAGTQTAVWGAVTNGSTPDVGYFAILKTYTTSACTTPVDTVTVQFIYTAGQTVTLNVDPSFAFTVSGTSSGATCNGATSNVTTTATTVPLGTPTVVTNSIGVQNLTITTNSGNGYTINARYTGPPANGANTIDAHTGSNAAPTTFSAAGTEAYGYTSNDAVLGTGTVDRFTSGGGNKWAAFTTTNAEVAYSAAGVTSEVTCLGHQAGVAGTTPSGLYTTTAIYTATPLY